jgi:hypothetical protein
MLRHILLGVIVLVSGSTFVAPRAVQAGPPDAIYSTIPPVMVGTLTGHRVGNGYGLVLRDSNANRLAYTVVQFDFTDTPIIPADVQVFPTYNDCGSGKRAIYQTTDGNGQIVVDAAITGFTNTANVKIYAAYGSSMVYVTSIKARSTDCVTSASAGGSETTGLPDYAYFANNFTNNPSAQETDFDLNGSTGLGDFAIFSYEYTHSAATTLCTP